jgi:hypothetical protein
MLTRDVTLRGRIMAYIPLAPDDPRNSSCCIFAVVAVRYRSNGATRYVCVYVSVLRRIIEIDVGEVKTFHLDGVNFTVRVHALHDHLVRFAIEAPERIKLRQLRNYSPEDPRWVDIRERLK